MSFLVVILISQVTALLGHSCLEEEESLSRSSLIKTTANHRLRGFTFKSQRFRDILKCAHACLADDCCLSFNFEDGINGECQLNNETVVAHDDFLYYSKRFTYGEIQNRQRSATPEPSDSVFVFTTLGARGRRGPNDTRGYKGTNLEDSVTLENGKQLWRVPQTAVYSIEAYGASGANGTCRNDTEECHQGGLGARVMGSFNLTKDTMLTILVGQQGQVAPDVGLVGGGGGGGSFVVCTSKQLPLVVAGGGGGGGKPLKSFQDGDPGQANENGSMCGGFGGKGGKFCDISGAEVPDLRTGSAAGFQGDGVTFPAFFPAAQSFTNGGLGGKGPSDDAMGGFGGGGLGLELGGGGGGYSGGGIMGDSSKGTAGGGGSINVGTSQENQAGINYGDGRVIIKMV